MVHSLTTSDKAQEPLITVTEYPTSSFNFFFTRAIRFRKTVENAGPEEIEEKYYIAKVPGYLIRMLNICHSFFDQIRTEFLFIC